MPKSTAPQPEWDRVLTALAVQARQVSQDADHVLTDLAPRFDEVLAQLEAVAGWKTARVRRPVLILGSLDGIETGIRQLIRGEPLETCVVERQGTRIALPTAAEKGVHRERVSMRVLRPAWALADMLQSEGWGKCGLWPDDVEWDEVTGDEAEFDLRSTTNAIRES
ncbi:hypothetical protein [Xanthobacter aminoxidans]|uniref:hypothetical protein n=1 Tax=Xanthobacter aminoxidans TaxID=186280 RepID=UPI002022E54C|nr:hypothetical protein [Xanthobacter aminoxidans]MCL8385788.1 hypothetical protein [Xanthobacter aminoxidans]